MAPAQNTREYEVYNPLNGIMSGPMDHRSFLQRLHEYSITTKVTPLGTTTTSSNLTWRGTDSFIPIRGQVVTLEQNTADGKWTNPEDILALTRNMYVTARDRAINAHMEAALVEAGKQDLTGAIIGPMTQDEWDNLRNNAERTFERAFEQRSVQPRQ